jgi:hypothetical protein
VINRLSKSSGFIKRKPQKITPFSFIAGFIDSCSKGHLTYGLWAACIGYISGKAVTKQGLFERMNESAVSFASQLFSHVIASKLKAARDSRLFHCFKRVLLQDSTTLSLPPCMLDHYPGNVSRGEQRAVARLQCIINITTMQWLHLSLDAYTQNDQSASPEVLPVLKKGDLLIRDLGYFVLETLKQIMARKAFLISRLRYGVIIFDRKGKQLNWKQLCKGKGIIDKNVLIGREHKIPVRIIMAPLPPGQVAERIRKARNHRDRRLHHSEDYYLWLRYNVFITNVEADKLSPAEILKAYKVRWQIETLFKTWKSGLHMQEILDQQCENIYRIKTTIYLLLMLFCLIMQKVYIPYYHRMAKN